MSTLAPVLLAILGSLFLSVGTILQWLGHEDLRRDPSSEAWKVARKGRWWSGMAFSAVGTLLHFTALWMGALALVQPLGALHIALTALGMGRLRREAILGDRFWGIVLVTLGTVLCLAGEAGVLPGQNPSIPGAMAFLAVLVALVAVAWLLPRAGARTAVFSGLAYSLAAVAWKAVSQVGAGPGGWVWMVLFAAGYLGGFALIQAGFRRGGAGVVNALATGTATALPMLAAVIVFEEPVSPLAWFGVALTALGVLLVGRVFARGARAG